MRKKLLAGQHAAAEGGPGADRAWRLAFSRAARDMMQLPVDFVGLALSRLSLAELLDLPPDRALILMLEGPDDGLGLLILSPSLLSALIEVMTMGRCGTNPPDPRKPTRTDAAMLAPLADLALANLEAALAEEEDLVWAGGFRFASFIEEARSLGLLLEDMAYRVLEARLSLAQGARLGQMTLVLPADGKGRAPQRKSRAMPHADGRPQFAAALGARLDAAPCQLDAVLARVPMPLADVMTLAQDQLFLLPNAALDQITLQDLDGRPVTEGKLGQHRGMRAVRLTQALGGAADQGPAALAQDHASFGTAPDSAATFASVEPGPLVTPLDFDFADFAATGTG